MHARAMLTLTAALIVGLCGCQSAQPRANLLPTTQPAATSDVPTDSSADLMTYIGRQPLLTAEAGYRAAYVLRTGTMFDGDFNALRERLVAEKIVDRVWRHAPDDYLTRADVGYLICRAADIRTGLNWNLFGLGRYANRELIYHNIANPGGDLNLVSGGEFQGIVRRADDYMAGAGAYAAATLGDDPSR